MKDVMKKRVFSATESNIPEIMQFVEQVLTKRKMNKPQIAKALLTTEEMVLALIRHATDDAKLKVTFIRALGEYKIRLVCEGQYFSFDEVKENLDFDAVSEGDETLKTTFERMLKKVVVENNKIKHRGRENIVEILVHGTQFKMLLRTLTGMVLGVLVGFLCKCFLSPEFTEFLITDVLGLVSEMFMNALKMIVAPLVFVSIMVSVSDFGDMASLGKIAIKVVSLYLLTSLCAIGIGWFDFSLFPIGDPRLQSVIDLTETSVTSASFSLRDTISNIVPDNFVNAFLEADMLQIIFIAVLLGASAAILGSKVTGFKKAIGTLNDILSMGTTVIISVLPLSVFCSMAKMIISTDFEAMSGAILWIPVSIAGMLMMLVIYGVLLFLFGRVRPSVFFKKFFPAMLMAFSTCSSFATVTTSMKQCEKLGISPKVYAFSIPLGATVNMDGSCVLLTVSALFMMRIFGVEPTSAAILLMVVTIMALSIGAPGVPGSSLICMAVLFPLLGVPAEAVSIVMGLYPIVNMVITIVNVTGDATVSLIVAKKEKLLDTQKYYE